MSKQSWLILRDALAELCLSFPTGGGYGYTYTKEDIKRAQFIEVWNYAFWEVVKNK